MKNPAPGIWVRIPLTAEQVAKTAAHAERIARMAELAPEVAQKAGALLELCAEAFAAIEKDIARGRKRKEKLPRARRAR